MPRRPYIPFSFVLIQGFRKSADFPITHNEFGFPKIILYTEMESIGLSLNEEERFDMFDIAVIEAGPAGGSAALFAAKAGKKTLLLDSGTSMTKRAWMENHYGIAEVSDLT